jgi:hypothetical protein
MIVQPVKNIGKAQTQRRRERGISVRARLGRRVGGYRGFGLHRSSP